MLTPNLKTIVASRLIKDAAYKVVRTAVEPLAETKFSLAILAEGTLRIEEDTEKTPTSSLLNLNTVALILAYSGVTAENAMKAIEHVCRPHMEINLGKAAEALSDVTELAKTLEKGKALFAAYTATLPKVPVKGDVTVKISELRILESPNEIASLQLSKK